MTIVEKLFKFLFMFYYLNSLGIFFQPKENFMIDFVSDKLKLSKNLIHRRIDVVFDKTSLE